MRDNKVKRYGHDRRRQQQQKFLSTALTVLLILGAAAAGWFAYPAAYAYFTRPQEVISAPAESSSTQADGSSSVVQTADEPSEDLLYAWLPPAQLSAGNDLAARFAELKSSGFNGIVIELKDETGLIRYNSSAAAAYAPQAVAADAFDLAAVLSAAEDAGLAVAGRLYAFRDPVAARVLYAAAVKYNHTEINWIDNSQAAGGKPWLNPNHSDAQAYIVALAREAASAGVSHIFLAGVQFPTGYSLDLATYSAAGVRIDKSAILSAFLHKAKAAVTDCGGDLSCMMDITGLLGTDGGVRFGDDPRGMVDSGSRILLDLSPEQFGSAFVYGNLALTSPALDPQNTLSATLAQADPGDGDYIGWISTVYTAQTQPEPVSKVYTQSELRSLMRTAGDYGIASFALCDPTGTYDTQHW